MISRVRNRIALPLLLATSAVVGCAHSAIPSAFTAAAIKPLLPSPSYKILFDFGTNLHGYDGAYPAASLLADGDTLYGTTQYGGTYGIGNGIGGTVFSVTRSGKETVLHTFDGNPDGANPTGAMISVDGTLFGTTSAGGVYDGGTVFEMKKNGGGFQVLHSFGNGTDGSSPRAGLVYVHGVLYGTTYLGGTAGAGTVFSINLNDDTEKVLHSFFTSRTDGASPEASLIFAKGNLYGTTESGGNGAGTIFRISELGAEAVLYSFDSSVDGNAPVAALILVKGNLYGTTDSGGSSQKGTLFCVSLKGQERVLHSFGSGYDGSYPEAALITYKGQLYGTTSAGGTDGWGTVFRIDPDGTSETLLHSFSASYAHDGLSPQAPLTRVRRIMYGTTYEGGVESPSCSTYDACRYGTVFKLGLP